MKPTVVVLAFLSAALAVLPASAEWTHITDGGTDLLKEGNNWELEIKTMTGGWLLKKYKSGSGVLDLRSVENDCQVKIVELDNGAIEKVTSLTEVYLPNSVINLNGATFKECSGLTKVELNEGLKAIGSANNNTFLSCTALKSINFPSTLERIGKNAFQNCGALELTDLVLPPSVTFIGDHAFAKCTKLTGSFTGSGVTTFDGEYQFEGTSLTNVTFMNITAIPNGLCFEAKKLQSANFGSNIISIGYRAFCSCSALTTVTYGGPVASIGGQAFKGCSQYVLGEHTFPAELKTLGDHAFADCSKLTGPLTFPGLETIDGDYTFESTQITGFSAPKCTTGVKGMFKKCSSLVSVEFSENLATLEPMFYIDNNGDGAQSLTTFKPSSFPKLTGTKFAAIFRGCSKLVMPVCDLSKTSIETVETYAFADCLKVGTIKFPETLTTINTESLMKNKASRVVWFCGPPPTTIGNKALWPDGGDGWVLVAGRKHAAKWKEDSNLTLLSQMSDTDKTKAKTVIDDLGLTGVNLIGKWTYQTNGATHWVVEELPKGMAIFVR